MDETLLQLLELSFRSPGDEAASSRFLEALSEAISPDARAVVVVEDPAPATLLFGASESRLVAGHLPRRPGGGPRVEKLPLGTVFELLPAPDAAARHPTVVGLLEPEGLAAGPGLGIVTTVHEGRASSLLVVLPRRGSDWVPTERDRELMDRLAPFVVQAVRLNFRMLRSGTLTTLLDSLVLGVVLADEEGRVTYVNESAAEMLGVEPGELPPEAGNERTEALYRTVRPASDGETLYTHPADGRPLRVLSTKLVWPSWRGYAGRRYARALFIGDPKRGTADPLGNLGEAYGLTPQEAQLASLLVGDYTLAQASEQLGITENTGRTVLKRVLAKTGTRRQASLVRLLLSGPGQIRPGRGGKPARKKRPKRREPPK